MRSSALILFALVTGASSLASQGMLLPRPCDGPTRPGGSPPFVPCRAGSSIERTRTDVRVRLVDRVLRYEVEERFVNRGNVVGEADYMYPLPNNAAFQDLQLEINGELVAGETFGANEARRMYEEIVRRQRDPALVEWMGHGMLRARIFPIAPGEEKRVLVRYQSVAVREGDALRVDYFGGHRTDADHAGASPVHLTLDYPATAGLGRAYSPTHQVDARERGSNTEIEVRGDASDATLLIPVARTNAAAISMLANARGHEDGFAMITVTPPAGARADVTPRDVTLIIDVSGSMSGAKIDQARAAGRQVLESLRPRDRFRLIDFSTDVHTFRDDFSQATTENLRAARSYLDALDATGSTNIEGALKEAMRGRVESGRLPVVLFITDGEPTVGEQSPERLAELVQQRRTSTDRRIFTFGLGADVNVTLLEQLAIGGHGTSQFVKPGESVERAVGVVASRLVDPVLTDVHVRVEGGVRLARMLPADGSDLFAGQDLVVFGRYTGSGQGRILVEGRQGDRPVTWTTTADFPEQNNANGFVAQLWASQRIGFLSAERRRVGGSPELDAEIRSLGERFSIPTEFTSYFVKEPGMGAARPATLGLSAVTIAGSPAPAAKAAQFDAARMASAQRSVANMAAADSVASAGEDRRDASDRRVGGRTFRLVSGIWTDQRPAESRRVVTVKAYSAAYFDLARKIPELSRAMSLGEQVTVVGQTIVLQIRTDSGVETLTPSDLTQISQAW